MVDTSLFPYDTFPIRLEFGEKKNITVCHFQCQEHLDKYLERYKLDKRTIKLDYRDGKPVESGKKNKTNIQPRTRKSNDGSTNRTKRSTKNVDASGNTHRTRKPKK